MAEIISNQNEGSPLGGKTDFIKTSFDEVKGKILKKALGLGFGDGVLLGGLEERFGRIGSDLDEKIAGYKCGLGVVGERLKSRMSE